MNMNPTIISVIIPVYNVKPYLNKCLDSVLNQTYRNLEILVIDDGSSDGSEKICDEYALRDTRIRVFHQTNAGQSSARNKGLEYATGEWIAFLDSDDWIEPTMYEKLLEAALQTGTDIVECLSRDCMLDQINSSIKCSSGNITILSLEDIIYGLYMQKIRFEIWNKLWRRQLIAQTRFICGQISEEVHFDRILLLRAGKIAYVDEVLHNYLVFRPGNTNTTFKKERLCIFSEFDSLMRDLEDIGRIDLANVIGCLAMDYAISIYVHAAKDKQDIDIKKRLIKEACKYYQKTYNRCHNRGYRRKLAAFFFHLHPQIYLWIRKIG